MEKGAKFLVLENNKKVGGKVEDVVNKKNYCYWRYVKITKKAVPEKMLLVFINLGL
ncbi:hypothetical protein [Desulfofundulus kuznetsovii]|uniref:hypothetical protein n=1 Tax=Desulfofundulus kuznetsovii TaxID=58135 RepID=UPI00338FF9ED